MKKGWQTKTLNEVCEIMNGGTPKTGVPEYWDGSHRWITPAEMGKRLSPYVGDTERKITDLGLRNSSAQMLPPNSVILSSRAPIGHLVINTKPMATNQGCKGLIPGNRLQYKFLYYYLNSIVELLNSLGTGATFKEISGGKLKEVTIPVPPLPEQQRIVGILDEAFEGIVTAKATAEKNLQNARALFESHLSSVFAQRGPSWPVFRLGNMVERLTNGYVGPTRDIYSDSGIPYLLARHVKSNSLTFDGKTFVSEAFNAKHRKSILKAGDVLLVQSGHIGHSAVVTAEHEGHNCHAMIVITPSDGKLDGNFLSWFFGSPSMQRRFEQMRTGSTIKHLNCGDVIELEVPTPALADQKRIVEEIKSVHLETQRLASLYERKLAALEEMKKSLLHRAFTGEL